MKLSIITCTYNSEKHIQKTIESVTAQNTDHTIFEHIFIDGNSSDNTLDILHQYKSDKYNKHKITIVQKKPQGIYNAMNEGIKVANGEYLLFLHSDDYLQENIINKYLKFIEKTGNLDFYYGKLNAVNSEGKYLYKFPDRKVYQYGLNKFILGLMCYVAQPSVIHKKILHAKYGYFKENYKIASDRDFRITLAENKVSNLFYNKVISNFRIHDDGASNAPQNKELAQKEINHIREEHFGKERYIMQIINFLYTKILH